MSERYLPVREVSEMITKGTTPTSIGRKFAPNGVRFLKIETFTPDGKYLPAKVAFVDDSTHNVLRRSQLEKNDVLFSIAGALGRTALVEREWLPANTNQAFAIIRPSKKKDAVHPRYLLWALRSESVIERIAEINVRAAQANLSLEQVGDFEIPIPEKSRQFEIAEALDSADAMVSDCERLIAKKLAVKQGMMQELLTGRTRLPGFSGEWRDAKLGEIAKIQTGKRNSQDNVAGGAYPFFIRSATVERIDSYSYDCEAILIPGEGGIGSIFHYVNGKFEVHQRVYKISEFSGTCGKFVYFYMSQFFGPHALEGSVKATVDSLRLPTFKSFELRLPEGLDEQEAIAAALGDADAEIEALEKRLESARAVKTGMMQELLTGRTRLPVKEDA